MMEVEQPGWHLVLRTFRFGMETHDLLAVKLIDRGR